MYKVITCVLYLLHLSIIGEQDYILSENKIVCYYRILYGTIYLDMILLVEDWLQYVILRQKHCLIWRHKI